MPQLLSSSAQTLLSVTAAKLREVEKQRLAYTNHSKGSKAQDGLEPTRALLISEVDSLASIVKTWSGPGKLDASQVIGGKLDLRNLQFWIQQAREDPSFNIKLLKDWKLALEMHIEQIGTKFDAAKLFGMLCDEWVKSGDSGFADVGTEKGRPSNEESETFVQLDQKQVLDQKEHLQSLIFNDSPVDVAALQQYLDGLFSSDKAATALSRLRFDLYNSQRAMEPLRITPRLVTAVIYDLLECSSLNEEQKFNAKEMAGNQTVLKEVASILNMLFSSLDTWAWPEKGLLVEMRSDMIDKFRACTDPDIVEAIFLHHLGSHWRMGLKTALRNFYDSTAWNRDDVLAHGQSRLQLVDLGFPYSDPDSIQSRRKTIRDALFLNGLQSNIGDKSRKVVVDEDNSQTPAEMAKKVLNTLATDCMANTAIHGSHAMVRTTFTAFEHSLPHDAILIILAYLGIPQKGLDFIQAYLATPLRFEEDDVPRIRKRGIPVGYALSTVISEAVRFVMDFAVNQRTDGLFLHRVQDEIWFWDSDVEKVAEAWNEMKTFVGLVGLELDASQTGSAYLGPQTAHTSLLPPGDLQWGLLKFDPLLSRFIIDQARVDTHIRTFCQRLAETKSVLGWVNVHNKYTAYLYHNFGGTPANCFGQEHIQDVIATFRRIQHELFPNHEQGAIGQLRERVLKKFNVRHLPDGYFYFPTSRGGLGLKNVLVGLFALQKRGRPLLGSDGENRYVSHPGADVPLGGFLEVKQIPTVEKKFSNLAAKDGDDYLYFKEKWESAPVRQGSQSSNPDSEGRPEFMSLEEYLSLREITLVRWGELYVHMLQGHTEVNVLHHHMPSMNALFFSAQLKYWGRLDWETQWLVSMYGEEVVNKFGGLNIVEESLIPVGIVELLKTSQVKSM